VPRTRRQGWTSASELAEFAFCPRAWYYSTHPPGFAPDRRAVDRSEGGRAFHTEALRTEQHRETGGASAAGWMWLGIAATVLLLLAGLVLR